MKIIQLSIILFFLTFGSAKAQLSVCEPSSQPEDGFTWFGGDKEGPFGLYYEIMINIANYMGEELHFAFESREGDCRYAADGMRKYLKRTKVYSAIGKWVEVKDKEPFDFLSVMGWTKKGVDLGNPDKWLDENSGYTLINFRTMENG
jgi:hypothetical protein